MSSIPSPTRTLWWGVAIAVGGALLIILAPAVYNAVVTPNTEAWQGGYLVLDTVLSVARIVLPPLGAALIAAGLVMRYVDGRLRGAPIGDRPRRLHLPPRSS